MHNSGISSGGETAPPLPNNNSVRYKDMIPKFKDFKLRSNFAVCMTGKICRHAYDTNYYLVCPVEDNNK